MAEWPAPKRDLKMKTKDVNIIVKRPIYTKLVTRVYRNE